ncbi:MAG: flagellar hook-basal body complex protein FliE [Rhodopirellula sp.]|nr:flagellar hook-basal body complex protein FliE [Rhodopirellula sp.]
MSQINGLGTPLGLSDPLFLMKTLSSNSTGDVSGPSFQNLMFKSISEVAGLQHSAQTTIGDSLSGGDVTMAESVIAVREAELATKLMLQVQRKLVDAWKELKNMQM